MKLSKKVLTLGLALAFLAPLSVVSAFAIDYGNNSSQWANDGECDDPRFAGQGMATTLLDEDTRRDANDCRSLFNRGLITVITYGTNSSEFGNNSSEWAYDGECDDPRFFGTGMANILLDEDTRHDAADCLTLYNNGSIDWR